MAERNDGGQAFPVAGDDEKTYTPGMSLRDWFAGQAMSCMGLEMVATMQKMPEKSALKGTDDLRVLAAGTIARDCYRIADAMLEVREAS